MFNTALLLETVGLVLVAYLAGCTLGYGLRAMIHAGRGTRSVPAVAPAPVVRLETKPAPQQLQRPRSPAARLAARVDEPLQPANLVVAKPATTRPGALSSPRGGKADDLKQIKGIGPKIEAALNAMGYYHLDQLALWSRGDAEFVEDKLAFKGRVGRERWVEQAGELLKKAAA